MNSKTFASPSPGNYLVKMFFFFFFLYNTPHFVTLIYTHFVFVFQGVRVCRLGIGCGISCTRRDTSTTIVNELAGPPWRGTGNLREMLGKLLIPTLGWRLALRRLWFSIEANGMIKSKSKLAGSCTSMNSVRFPLLLTK